LIPEIITPPLTTMSAQAVGKYAAQKLLRKQMKDYKGKKVETGDVFLPALPHPYVRQLTKPISNRTPTSPSSKTPAARANSKK